MHDKFGIIEGLMAMVHAITATAYSGRPFLGARIRKGAGVTWNIIPSSTGAAKSVSECLPASIQNPPAWPSTSSRPLSLWWFDVHFEVGGVGRPPLWLKIYDKICTGTLGQTIWLTMIISLVAVIRSGQQLRLAVRHCVR